MTSVSPSSTAVLFDFDHTLFAHDDSGQWVLDAYRSIDREPGEAAARAFYDRMRKARREVHVAAALRGCQKSTALHHHAHQLWFTQAGAEADLARALYARLLSPRSWTPYSDVAATLAVLKEHAVAVAVVSNVGWDIRPTFTAHGLAEFVDTFVLSCEEGAEKPEPQLFRTACDRLGTTPQQALMVGDDPVNDGAAIAVGIPVYLLPDQPLGTRRGLGAVLPLIHSRLASSEGDAYARP